MFSTSFPKSSLGTEVTTGTTGVITVGTKGDGNEGERPVPEGNGADGGGGVAIGTDMETGIKKTRKKRRNLFKKKRNKRLKKQGDTQNRRFTKEKLFSSLLYDEGGEK